MSTGFVQRSLDYLFGGPRVGGALGDRLSAWRRAPRPPRTRPHRDGRYVVMDSETSGLDLRRDRLISLGAVGIRGGRIALADAYGAVLRQPEASADANILIHGIGGEAQRGGRDPALALIEFLEFCGKDPIIAFRVEFDRPMLVRAGREILGVEPKLIWIDLAWLLPALFRGTPCDSLDEWLAHFGIVGTGRHEAVGDAWTTAQLALIALTAAEAAGMGTSGDLVAMQKAQAWLGTRR